ncbi:MAG TPA: DUF4254 domain-containing protein [Chitinophagaceae bacterium]|nr:DUF4254 domain-containing protein [Chitinophagaceae bacterium]
MIDIDLILELQKNCIAAWHMEVILTQKELPWKYIEENNQYNFLLWHEEDIARIKDIDPLRIVEAKRNIDKFNQLRNNAIEKIDEWILTFLTAGNDSELAMHSETPGMMMDRLSIMALKRYHMFEETVRPDASDEHKAKCSYKVSVLDEQIDDLADCLRTILKLLSLGKLKFKVYRQFKMYNDPELNPQLYKQAQLKIVK